MRFDVLGLEDVSDSVQFKGEGYGSVFLLYFYLYGSLATRAADNKKKKAKC